MKALTLTAAALFLASTGLTTLSHAELVQAQPLSSHFDTPNLANDLLEHDSSAINSPLFNKASENTVNKAATPATVSITVANADSLSSDDTDDSLVEKVSNLATSSLRKFSQQGLASWYGRQFHGRPTASGERFDMNSMTAAHRSLPLSCYIRVTNRDNGKSVVVKVNDRGPFHGKRILDLSYAAAQQLGITQRGTGNVTIERVDGPNAK